MIGKTISHFKIQSDLGEGGMGKVYLALDTELQREVALKFLLPHLIENEKIKSRFKQEARTLALLNHPNIITIYEVGDFEGSSFIATEYVKGQSLENILNEQSLSVKQALKIIIQLCEGLREAHAQGIIHRDIKPGNLLIEKNDHVKILDFGLAKLKEAGRKTTTSTTLGTLYYLPPEQIQNSTIDQRADIFQVGIVLYEMITGQLPFKGDYEASVIYSIINEDPEPLARYKSGISENLQNIVFKALRKNPEMRYQHVDDLLSDLKNELNETDPSTKSRRKPTEEKMSRKLVAIMFTDIVGYSHMMGKDEEKTFKLLEDYDSIVAPIINNHNGQILKKIGDGLFCEFSSALEAVECSIKIQKALQDYNTSITDDYQLKVRIGIHVGDVIKKRNDLFGDGVNVAARIEPLAPPGGIYISDTVYSAISSHPKFKINNVGPKSLKNINKEHTLYQILTGVEESKVKSKATASGPHRQTTNVPVRARQSVYHRLVKKNKYIWLTGVVIVVVGTILLYTSTNLLDFSPSISTDSSDNQSSLVVEDKFSKYPRVSELLQSEKSKIFITEVLKIDDSDTLLEYLEANKNLGRLTFGRRGNYAEIEGKYIIIVDEQQIYTLLLYLNQRYFDVMGDGIYDDLSKNFRGKIEIWVNLL